MTGKSNVNLYLNPEFLAEVDSWRALQRPILSRSAAIRTLTKAGLACYACPNRQPEDTTMTTSVSHETIRS
jgi:hypothetical protein